MQSPRIIKLDRDHLAKAQQLVNVSFPHQSPLERISLKVYGRKGTWIYSIFSFCARADILDFWIAVDESGNALGICGLYQNRRDRAEAVWLGWYAVHPDARGQGVGGVLLRHAIDEASKLNLPYLRLYTSVSELVVDSDKAQQVYEKFGFKVKSRKKSYAGFIINENGFKVLRDCRIIREKQLR